MNGSRLSVVLFVAQLWLESRYELEVGGFLNFVSPFFRSLYRYCPHPVTVYTRGNIESSTYSSYTSSAIVAE